MRIEPRGAAYRSLGNGILINELANIVGDVDVGQHTRIDAFVTITGRVRIGARCHISTGASIFGSDGVEIGDECSVSPGAMIFTGTYDRQTGHRANPMLIDKVYSSGPVRIGNRCIVGAAAVVLPNVALADDVLIGALSLVKTNLAAGCYVGMPARRI